MRVRKLRTTMARAGPGRKPGREIICATESTRPYWTATDIADSLMLLGLVLLLQGDLARAHARFEESLAVSREVGYKRNIGLSIFYLGSAALLQGDVALARSLLEESLVLFKEMGERGRIAE